MIPADVIALLQAQQCGLDECECTTVFPRIVPPIPTCWVERDGMTPPRDGTVKEPSSGFEVDKLRNVPVEKY